jgi:pimeloyl-ACP methyl ester carboxylesterase
MGTVRHRGHGLDLVGDEYGREGDPPVLLFHGGGQTRHSWKNAAATLGEQGFHAISYDLRGHGQSDWSTDGAYTTDLFGADVRALAQRHATAPALVGASLGGIASMIAIGEHPAGEPPPARALVLVDVAARLEAEGTMKIGNFMRSGIDGFASLEEAADAISAYNPNRARPTSLAGLAKNLRRRDDGRWVWHWDPRFLQPRLVDGLPDERSYTHEGRLSDAARNITVPTLLVRGRESDVLSEAGARHLLGLVPQAEYVDVSGAGHMVAGDQNDWFNDAVIGFLTRVR